MKKNNYLTLSTAFWVLVKREIYRFLVLYNQTIIPGLLSSLLYIIVFGTTLGSRIKLDNGIEYINFIIPIAITIDPKEPPLPSYAGFPLLQKEGNFNFILFYFSNNPNCSKW